MDKYEWVATARPRIPNLSITGTALGPGWLVPWEGVEGTSAPEAVWALGEKTQ
jgi:hypothetical protein